MIFGKKVPNKNVFRFSLQLRSEIFLILRTTERGMVRNVHWFSCKVPFILVRFYRNFNFLDSFSKNTRVSKLTKNCPMTAEFFQADRQTDSHDEANSRFSQIETADILSAVSV